MRMVENLGTVVTRVQAIEPCAIPTTTTADPSCNTIVAISFLPITSTQKNGRVRIED